MRNRRWWIAGVMSLALLGQRPVVRAASNPKSALVTVSCGITGQIGKGEDDDGGKDGNECRHLGGDDDGNHGVDRLEWYSGGVLIYTEKQPRTLGRNDGGGKVTFLVTGNNDPSQFNTFYVNPQTSLLASPDLTIKVYSAKDHDEDAKHPPQLVLFQPYAPVASAVWSKHSEDTVQLAADIAAGDAATLAASKAYTDQSVASEAAARAAGDAAQKQYTDGQIAAVRAEATADEAQDTQEMNNEMAARMSADNQLQANINNEAAARQQGDQQTLASANQYTDQQVASEAAARKQGDADTLAASKSYTDSSVANEAAARQAADNTLQTNINNEAAARQAADSQLQTNINNEAAARQQGDQQTLASANQYTDQQVASEVAARKQGDADTLAASKSYTDSSVANEAAARQAADNQLQTSINNEAATRQAADSQLQNNINNEAAARQAGDNTLQNNIDSEAAARQQGDQQTLASAKQYTDQQVASEAAARKQGDADTLAASKSYTDSSVANEAASRQAADTTLQNNINSEASARQQGDQQTLSSAKQYTDQQVAAETSRAQAAENTLTTNLNNEKSRAQAAENTLTTNLNNEIARAQNAETTITNNLNSEISRAKAAEATLTSNLNNEISRAQGAEATLTSNLNNEISRAQGAESTLTSNLNNEVANRSAGDASTLASAQSYADANFVHRTGNLSETVTGIKTFLSALVAQGGVNATGATVTANQLVANSHCFGADCRTSWNNMDANSVSPLPRNCPAGQSPVSTGAYAWKCSITCANLTADCDNNSANGCETNIAATSNCGACGNVCPVPPNSSSTCNNLQCGFACNNGYANCDAQAANGCEINTTNDTNNCGACNAVCTLPNATPACANSACAVGSCNPGFRDCDAFAGNGCEVNTNTNVNNCGACGSACNLPNATPTCSGGACQVASCNAGFGNCDNVAANGCETNLNSNVSNCGSCGHVCAMGNACVNGACVANNVCNITTNVALQATAAVSAGGSGFNYGPQRANNNVFEAQECPNWAWISAGNAPGGGQWFQYTWGAPQKIGKLHMDTSADVGGNCGNGRTAGAAQIQWWNGAQWITDGVVANQHDDWDYTFTAPVTTTQVRLFDMYATNVNGQTSNPMIFELQVFGCQ